MGQPIVPEQSEGEQTKKDLPLKGREVHTQTTSPILRRPLQHSSPYTTRDATKALEVLLMRGGVLIAGRRPEGGSIHLLIEGAHTSRSHIMLQMAAADGFLNLTNISQTNPLIVLRTNGVPEIISSRGGLATLDPGDRVYTKWVDGDKGPAVFRVPF